MILNATTATSVDRINYIPFFDTENEIQYSKKFTSLVEKIPEGTTLHRLLLECHEGVINPKVEIPSDEMVADVMLEVLEDLLRPERIIRDVDEYGIFHSKGETTFENPIFESKQGEEYLSQVKAVFRLYRNSPILKNLQNRVSEVLNYCANSTNKSLEQVQAFLERKQQYGTPLMEVDITEIIGASLKFLAEHRNGELKSPLLSLFNIKLNSDENGAKVIGGNVMLRKSYLTESSVLGDNKGNLKLHEIKNILNQMTGSLNDGKDRVEKSKKNLTIISLLMLITILTSACAQLDSGTGPEIIPVVTDDDVEDDYPTITAPPGENLKPTQQVVPTATQTQLLIPTDTSTPTVIPTEETVYKLLDTPYSVWINKALDNATPTWPMVYHSDLSPFNRDLALEVCKFLNFGAFVQDGMPNLKDLNLPFALIDMKLADSNVCASSTNVEMVWTPEMIAFMKQQSVGIAIRYNEGFPGQPDKSNLLVLGNLGDWGSVASSGKPMVTSLNTTLRIPFKGIEMIALFKSTSNIGYSEFLIDNGLNQPPVLSPIASPWVIK